MAMATGAGDHGLEEPTSEWISLLPNAVVQALQTHLPGVRIKSTFRVANSEANSFALEWWEQPTCAKLGKLLFHVATAGDSYERSGGNGLWMAALLAPARVCKQWTESMAIHLYVLCRELNVGYQAPEELVVLNDLTCACNLTPIMQRVSELIAVEGSLCEWSNAVLLALKHEQYVRAEDGYDLRTAYARDVTVQLDSLVGGTTSSVEMLLLLVCAVAYDSSKQSDMVSCIQLLDQEPQVTARNKLPSKKNKTAAPAVASGEISAAGDNHGTAMSRADNNIQPASEADHTAGKAPPLKKTKNSPEEKEEEKEGKEEEEEEEEEEEDNDDHAIQQPLEPASIPAAAAAAPPIPAAAAAAPGKIKKKAKKLQKAAQGKIKKKAKKGKIASSGGMTKEEMKKIEVEVLKPFTAELSVLMRLTAEAQDKTAVDACEKCLNSGNPRSPQELLFRDRQVDLLCAVHAGNNVVGKNIDFLEGEKSNMPARGFLSGAIQKAFEDLDGFVCYSMLGQGQGSRALFVQHLRAHTRNPDFLGWIYYKPSVIGHYLCIRRHNDTWARVDSLPRAPAPFAAGIHDVTSRQVGTDLLRMYDENPEGKGMKGLCLLAVHKSGDAEEAGIERTMRHLKKMVRVHKRVLHREKEQRHAYSEDLRFSQNVLRAYIKNYIAMDFENTDAALESNEQGWGGVGGLLNAIDNALHLGAHHHMPRRAAYRIFVTQHFREFAAIGTASRKALEKYFNPQNPHKDRVTKYISKVAPLMAFIERCRSASSRDKKFNEFGYFVNHPLRANAVAYAAMKGMKAEEVFDLLRDEYVMLKEVGEKYAVVDQALRPWGYTLKMFFVYLGVGKWQGGCIVCRLVNVKTLVKRIAGGVLSAIPHVHGDREGRAALKALCPELFTKVALEDAHKKKGIRRCENDKPNDVLLCQCTQALLRFWDMPFDMKFVNLCWLLLFTPHLTQPQVADLVRKVGSEGIGVVQLKIELRRYDILRERVNGLFFERGGLSSLHHLSTASTPESFALETALDVVRLMQLYPGSKLGMEGGARGGAGGGADDAESALPCTLVVGWRRGGGGGC